MELIRSRDWYQTPAGDRRGYIEPYGLKELWFHTGTACNLNCAFCLEGSGPGDKRLELVRLADVEPFIADALALGVEQFSFTGGEPFLAKDIVRILVYAASRRPCLLLTNGTDALHKRLDELVVLRQAANPVAFRISLDHPDAARHDAGRGAGNFRKALDGLKQLHRLGFRVSVARHLLEGEDAAAVDDSYRDLFVAQGLPPDLNIVAFPDFLPPGSAGNGPHITTHCMTHYQSEESRRAFMCAYSKMVVKQKGRMRVYACTLVDDDPEYDLGPSLPLAMESCVSMKHQRCFSCFKYGSSCSES